MSNEIIAVNNCEPDLVQEWRITVDGYFKNNAERQMLNDDMSQEAVDTIFSNTRKFFARIFGLGRNDLSSYTENAGNYLCFKCVATLAS